MATAEFKRAGLGVGLAGAVSIIWVLLTAETGLTFHLAPGVIAAAPAFAWVAAGGEQAPAWRLSLLIGWPAVAAGWLALEMTERTPTATFVSNQPGGVEAEVVVTAVLGAGLAARLTRPRT